MKHSIRRCPSPLCLVLCKFGKILVVGEIIGQNFINKIIVLEITSNQIFLIFLFIRYDTVMIKQSSSDFLRKNSLQFTFVIFNEVNLNNFFSSSSSCIWSFKANSIFIIIKISFCSVSSILIGSFSSPSFSSELLVLYLINVLSTGLPVAKHFNGIYEPLCVFTALPQEQTILMWLPSSKLINMNYS